MKRKYLKVEGIKCRVDKRKNYKNIRLRVIPPHGEVSCTAPEYIKDNMIKGIIKKNIKSIKETIKKQKEIYKDRLLNYEDGSFIKIFGKECLLKIKKSDKKSIAIHSESISLNLKDPRNLNLVEKEIEKVLRDILRRKIEFYINKYKKLMGLEINGFSIRKMKTKWGSCNISHRFIWINLELVKYKQACLEYVVVHELCHLLEKNHGKNFYKCLEKYFSDYKIIEKFLDQQIIVN